MSEETTSANRSTYDVIVIGAGFCGIIFLKYARDRGLRCLVLEKQDDVGGMWKWLPAWQDIQNRRQDFAINDVPLDGVTQPAIHQHARAWVERYDLAPFIELGCEVTSASWMGNGWRIETNRGPFRAPYLVVASGVQNEPFTPRVERSDSKIEELHSARLERPEDLAQRRVVVVGGGASGWDLLDLAIERGAEEIHWVYPSSPRWFQPTTRSKQNAWPNLRELAIVQTFSRSARAASRFLGWMVKRLYKWFRITELEPREPFDLRRHQLNPGRSSMLRNLDAIQRHRSKVRSIRGREITLANGERIEADLLLWGTGYRMNLAHLDLPEYRHIDRLEQLLPRLGSLVRSLDYPNLFFIGMSLAESTSSTPFFAAIQSKSIVAHIQGRCEIPEANVPHHIAYWNLIKHFASFDRATYPRIWWRIKYFLLAWWYLLFRNKSVKI